jgi:hypothetical protein
MAKRLACLTSLSIAGCTPEASGPAPPNTVVRPDRIDEPRRFSSGNLTIWWDRVPESIREKSSADSRALEPTSNIRPADYIGPDACRSCHAQQHELWSRHPHRFMNAMAQGENVLGDFSGTATLHYLGGKATFFEADGGFRVRLRRGTTRRIYQVNQTIGSRFFQYYVGKQLAGPEADGHKFFRNNHVLPFEYWIDRREWVPVVHIGSELTDEKRHDPFDRAPLLLAVQPGMQLLPHHLSARRHDDPAALPDRPARSAAAEPLDPALSMARPCDFNSLSMSPSTPSHDPLPWSTWLASAKENAWPDK